MSDKIVSFYCHACREEMETEPVVYILRVVDSRTVIVDMDVICPVCGTLCLAARQQFDLREGTYD